MPEEMTEEKEVKSVRPAKKRVKKVAVNVIKIQGQAAIVEWVDKGGLVRRVFIPRNEVSADGKVEEKTLSEGAPYGVEWEKVEFPEVTSKQLAQALRRAGIWTVEDLRLNPNLAVSAIQSIYRVDLAALNKYAKSLEEE